MVDFRPPPPRLLRPPSSISYLRVHIILSPMSLLWLNGNFSLKYRFQPHVTDFLALEKLMHTLDCAQDVENREHLLLNYGQCWWNRMVSMCKNKYFFVTPTNIRYFSKLLLMPEAPSQGTWPLLFSHPLSLSISSLDSLLLLKSNLGSAHL